MNVRASAIMTGAPTNEKTVAGAMTTGRSSEYDLPDKAIAL